MFHPHKAEFHRRNHDVSLRMEVTIAPDDDVEFAIAPHETLPEQAGPGMGPMVPVGIRGLNIHDLVVLTLRASESAAPESKGPAPSAIQPTVTRAREPSRPPVHSTLRPASRHAALR